MSSPATDPFDERPKHFESSFRLLLFLTIEQVLNSIVCFAKPALRNVQQREKTSTELKEVAKKEQPTFEYWHRNCQVPLHPPLVVIIILMALAATGTLVRNVLRAGQEMLPYCIPTPPLGTSSKRNQNRNHCRNKRNNNNNHYA